MADMTFEEYRDLLGVDRFIRDELVVLDASSAEDDDEPEVTFSVRIPYTSMGELQNLAEYFGDKKTPFASRLLAAAIREARISLQKQEIERGNGEHVAQHLGQRVEHKDDNGVTGWSVSPGFDWNGRGEE